VTGQLIKLPFAIGEKVRIDGEIVGTVIGAAIYPHGIELKVSWCNSGALVEAWVADWRCEEAAK